MGAADIDKDDAGGPRRVRGALSLPAAPTDDVSWQAGAAFATAQPASELIRHAVDVLRAQGLALHGVPILVRHRAGDRGLPAADGDAGFRFAIDLTSSPRTLHGGLLMFADADGRVQGWRAEAGALTLWTGADPELTELAPGAPERLTLVGQANPGSEA